MWLGFGWGGLTADRTSDDADRGKREDAGMQEILRQDQNDRGERWTGSGSCLSEIGSYLVGG